MTGPEPAESPVPVVRGARRRGLVEAEILETAARLFAARGFAATSMQDIADALGSSRPALYHYFRSKDEILGRLMSGLADGAERAVEDAAGSTGAADVKLREFVAAIILPIAESPGRFRLLLTSDVTHTFEAGGRTEQVQRDIYGAMSALIAEGVAAGLFKRCDVRLTTFSLLGMVNWVAWWYSPDRGDSAAELASTIADLALDSIRAERPTQGGASAKDVIASIRRDLNHLAELTGG